MKAVIALAIALAAAQIPPADQPTLTTAPAALYSTLSGQQRVGGLTYMGGLYLISSSPRLGGLSGLEAQEMEDGTILFSAVTDAGDFATFTGRLDDRGLLVGAQDLKFAQLRDDRGQPFYRRADKDAEDLSLLEGRPGYLVAFEGEIPRIIAYEDPTRANGAQGRVDLPQPLRKFKKNTGVQAIAALPGGSVAVGAEDGRIFLCPKGQAACVQVSGRTPLTIGPGYQLSSFDHLSNGELVAVYRAKNLLAHWDAKIVHIRIIEGKARFTELADMKAWLGNLEGIAALPLPDNAGWKIYVVSDNAHEAREPTLLLAFDWRP